MQRLSDLGFLFSVVAAVEAVYALTAILTPPGQIEAVTGWVLSADGKWLVKLLGIALASQAWVAWTLRDRPHIGVAKALALYQLGSATADWMMWIVLADQNVFSTTLGPGPGDDFDPDPLRPRLAPRAGDPSELRSRGGRPSAEPPPAHGP